MSLLQSGSQNISWNAIKLSVKLQSSDELGSTSNLKVHISESIFCTENIGQSLEDMLSINISRNQAHSNTSNWSLQRHTSGEQRKRRSTNRSHRSGTVRTNSFRHLTNSVWELFTTWQNWHQSLLRQSTMTNLATLWRSNATSFTSGIWRHFVIVHIALSLRTRKRIHLLLHLKHIQSSYAQNLGFTTLE
ncbi:Uncharacterised protein [Chlamydia trachomatis]|nr:Uncharacterised protein [Chlamydia trachomatis]